MERVDGDKLSILFCNARMREQQMKLAGARQKTKQRSQSLVQRVLDKKCGCLMFIYLKFLNKYKQHLAQEACDLKMVGR